MSVAEYLEWRAYEAVEPFGHPRHDLAAAVIAAAAQAPHVTVAPKLSDFLLFPEDRFDPPAEEEEDWDEWDRVLDQAAARAAASEGTGGEV